MVSERLLVDGFRNSEAFDDDVRAFDRVDPLFRACPGQFGHPSYLHGQVSPADHGLSGQRLFLKTAGERSCQNGHVR